MSQRHKPSLTLKRHIKANPEKVFAAWTQAEHLKNWFGPGKVCVETAETDLKVGGRFRIVMVSPDGEYHRVGGTYKEIVENERVVFSWAWESTPERVSQVTIKLAAKDGGTNLTLIHEQFADEETRDKHSEGWNGSLDKLEARLSGAGEQSTASSWSHGLFHWNELMTRDVAKSKAFYEEIIGWKFEAMPMDIGTYWVAKADGAHAGGMFEMCGEDFEGVTDEWVAYLAVDDIDARYAKAVKAGAKPIRPPFDVPGVGRIAIFLEPGGAKIGWMTPACP